LIELFYLYTKVVVKRRFRIFRSWP